MNVYSIAHFDVSVCLPDRLHFVILQVREFLHLNHTNNENVYPVIWPNVYAVTCPAESPPQILGSVGEGKAAGRPKQASGKRKAAKRPAATVTSRQTTADFKQYLRAKREP